MKTNLIKTSALAIALFASTGAHALSINSLYKDYMITFYDESEPAFAAEAKAANVNADTKVAKKLISVEEAITRVEFDFDGSGIRGDYNNDLDQLAELIKEKDLALSLAGHADNIGEHVYNWHLSERRADSVRDYLISKGVDSTNIATTEFGFTEPIASNTTPEGRQKNRRVEVKII